MNSNDAKRVSDNIFGIINKQFVKIIQENPDFYQGTRLIISDEQSFVMEEDRENNNIYAVIKFLPSSLLFGQYVQNVLIDFISEHNGIDVCRTLLNEYALRYNLDTITQGKEKIKQVYTTPVASSTFNEVFDGYRTAFSMSGTFVVSDNAYSFDLYYEGQLVECISNDFQFAITPNTQPYFNSNNLTRSYGEFGTISFGFTSYLTQVPIINKCISITLKDKTTAPEGIDTPFNFKIKFSNGLEINETFKLVSFSASQFVGDLPACQLTFTM